MRSKFNGSVQRAIINCANIILSLRFTRDGSAETERPVVLFASYFTGNSMRKLWIGHVECLLAKYLQIRHSAKPWFLLKSKHLYKNNVFNGFGLHNIIYSGDFGTSALEAVQVTEIKETTERLSEEELTYWDIMGVPLGRLALASARLKLKKSKVFDEPADRDVVHKFIEQGLHEIETAKALIDRIKPDIIITNHTTYIDRGGIIFHLGMSRNIQVCSWQARTSNSIIVKRFEEEDRYKHVGDVGDKHFQQLDASTRRHDFVKLSEEYLDKRMAGVFAPLPRAPKIGLKNQQDSYFPKFDNDKPVVGVFTHLPWDAAGSFYRDLFPSLRDWIERTAACARQNSEVNWIFRVHPAEAVRGSSEDTAALIRSITGDANHVDIIEGGQQISSYAIARLLTAAVTVRGTLSVELPCLGIPVICAGTGPASVGQVAICPEDRHEYEHLLATIPSGIEQLNSDQIDRAKLLLYAYLVENPCFLSCVKDFSSLGEMVKVSQEKLLADDGLGKAARILLSGLQDSGGGSLAGNIEPLHAEVQVADQR